MQKISNLSSNEKFVNVQSALFLMVIHKRLWRRRHNRNDYNVWISIL